MNWKVRAFLMMTLLVPAMLASQPVKKKSTPPSSARKPAVSAPIDLVLTEDYMTTSNAQMYRSKKADLAKRAKNMLKMSNETGQYAELYISFQKDLEEAKQAAYWNKLPDIVVPNPPSPTADAYYLHRLDSKRKASKLSEEERAVRDENRWRQIEETRPAAATPRPRPPGADGYYYYPKNRFGPSLYDHVRTEGGIDTFYNADDERNNRQTDYQQLLMQSDDE